MTTDRAAPDVTIAIVTKDRSEELRNAVSSALKQEGSIEVLVVDDGSTDGTPEMIRSEFPAARLERFEASEGIAVRRNNATNAARGEIIVSIDDDAVFSTPRVVAETLLDFDHPRVAAVAVPYTDVRRDRREHQRAPHAEGRWVTTIFRATAYAIRRDVLMEVGGFGGDLIYHQGEEWDLSLRLLDQGYVVRLGRAAPIHHFESPKRSTRRMDVFGRRNEILISWMYFPLPWNFLYMAGYIAKGLRHGLCVGRSRAMVTGIWAGLRVVARERRRRNPLSRSTFTVDRRVRRAHGLPLEQVEGALPDVPQEDHFPPPRQSIEPGAARSAIRAVRTRLTRIVGREVRCERCGAVLFRGMPVIWQGRLNLIGAESNLVRVDWDKMNRLTFRHVQMDHCVREPGTNSPS